MAPVSPGRCRCIAGGAGCRLADLRDTGVTVNLLLPGGATVTGMLPAGAQPLAGQRFLDPAVMGPPIVWLASGEAAGVHGERITAAEFDHWLRDRQARP